MSLMRSVKLGNINLDLLKNISMLKGRKVNSNYNVKLYNREEKCDLVIDNIGFKILENGTIEAVYDDMETEKYSNIIADYFEVELENNYTAKITRTEDKNWITIKVWR